MLDLRDIEEQVNQYLYLGNENLRKEFKTLKKS